MCRRALTLALLGGLWGIVACSERAVVRPVDAGGSSRCTSCHPGKETDPLAGAHGEAVVGCAACHSCCRPPARKPARAAWKKGLDEACTACHFSSPTNTALYESFLHWRASRLKGFYDRQGKCCSDCHGHGASITAPESTGPPPGHPAGGARP